MKYEQLNAEERSAIATLKRLGCGLLGICQRQVTASFPKASRHLRKIKHAPEVAKTLGEHLRLARIDRGLKQTEVAALLGVVYQTVEKWEHNVVPIGPNSRPRVLAFLGFEPPPPGANPTADSFDD